MNRPLIEELATLIADRIPGNCSMRASEVLQQIRTIGIAPDLFIFKDGPTATPTDEQLAAAAQVLEERYVEQMRLRPLADFASLSCDAQASWQRLAQRNYANVCDEPAAKASALYLELDGELPYDFESTEGRYFAREHACFFVEFYELGKMPAHRAAGMGGTDLLFAVPVLTTVNSLEPVTVKAREGRAWHTHLAYVDGQVVSWRQLERELWANGLDPHPRRHGKSEARECYLVEFFEDNADPGSMHYELTGHALMTAAQFANYVRYLTGYPRSSHSRIEELLKAHPASADTSS